jgi:hypothetical protein
MTKKSKYNWYSKPNYADKPKKWKFVSRPFIYSSSVSVIDDFNREFLGYIELEYKLVNRRVDDKWLNDKLKQIFGKIPKVQIESFERDKIGMQFISKIYLTKQEYIKSMREIKLKRILSDNIESD